MKFLATVATASSDVEAPSTLSGWALIMISCAQPLIHRTDTVSGWGAVQKVVLLCRLRPEDLKGAEVVLQQVDSMSRGIMSPVLRSRQLLLWAHLHKTRADWAVYTGQASQHLVVKALVAAERARALEPTCWRKVGSVIMQPCQCNSICLDISFTMSVAG